MDKLQEISNWSTSDVVSLLKKHGLDDCCHAVTRRQIDGDEFLNLTENKLTLWKSDLSRSSMGALLKFVDKLKQHPERYIEKRSSESHSEESMSDSGWDTDFDNDLKDNIPSEKVMATVQKKIIPKSIEFRNSLRTFQQNEKAVKEQLGGQCSSKDSNGIVDDSIYANFENKTNQEEEENDKEQNTYTNYDTVTDTRINKLPEKNLSKLHSGFENSLVRQLQEELRTRSAKKPVVGPKPNMILRKTETSERNSPRKSFLHNKARTQSINEVQSLIQTKMNVPPPPEPKPKQNFEKSPSTDKKTKSYPIPPKMINNLDLLANIPLKTEESDDDADYEPFDEKIFQQHQIKSMSRVGSKQSIMSGHQSSVESIYHPASTTSLEEEEEYEIYESIREAEPEDNGYYLKPIIKSEKPPPPLPAKPLNKSGTPSPTPSLSRPQKSKERSPDKKSATLPHSGSNTSLAAERATRPLPPPPDRQTYLEQPWFHNVTRQEAKALIEEPPDGHPTDGYFLIRPSSSNPNNPLTLVVWCKDRVYNVSVRRRPDNRYALGSPKQKEETFLTVEEIVSFYTRNELLLSTGGVVSGSTKLTNTPSK